MTRYFTHYWKEQTCEELKLLEGSPILINSRNNFRQRGISEGDYVYSVTTHGGKLYLIGRIEVGELLTRSEGVKRWGVSEASFYGNDLLIPRTATPHRFKCLVSDKIATELRFESNKHPTLKFDSSGHLDRQTLRGVRELTFSSASRLDKLLESPTRITKKDWQEWQKGVV